jgi:putative redox protein
MIRSERIEFPSAEGHMLAARLDMPAARPRAFALFAHCFSCSKDVFAASRIAQGLAERGVAVLRFDFTGLGASQGEFANTNFSSNVDDLVAAADWLRATHQAPRLMIGHSLGGAATLVAAARVPEARAVVTVGAPSSAAHVEHNFLADVPEIESRGEKTVRLAGRPFTIKRQFLEDVRAQNVRDAVAGLHRALLVMHAPLDQTVGIENATEIFVAAKHPKSFVSLDGADHLLTRREDAVYAAEVIAAWASRFALDPLPLDPPAPSVQPHGVIAMETGRGRYQNYIVAASGVTLADEPLDLGGDATGPTPHELLSAGLAACTTMTLRMYAERKGIDMGALRVEVVHERRSRAEAGLAPSPEDLPISVFTRTITLPQGLDDAVRQRLLEIADKCPVHRTLTEGAVVFSALAPA